MGDVNKTTLTGTAITNPSFTHLSNGTPLAIFTLKVREIWKTKSGQRQVRDNLIKIEALSKNSFWVRDFVSVGRRYYIDGYLRTDCINGVEETKVRVLHITEEENDEFLDGKQQGVKDGIRQAFAITDNSKDLEAAKAKIRLLLG